MQLREHESLPRHPYREMKPAVSLAVAYYVIGAAALGTIVGAPLIFYSGYTTGRSQCQRASSERP